MEKEKKKFAQLEGRVIDEHGLEVIRLLDKQLEEDKALFRFLTEDDLVDSEGVALITDLVRRHTKEFKDLSERKI